jgi:SH3-like domain-containing protein
LYDGPSTEGASLFVAPRGMPLDNVLAYGEWVKVRHQDGQSGYLKSTDIRGD